MYVAGEAGASIMRLIVWLRDRKACPGHATTAHSIHSEPRESSAQASTAAAARTTSRACMRGWRKRAAAP